MDQTTQTGHSDKNPCTEKEGYYQYVNGGGLEVMLDEEFVDTVANCPCSSSIRYWLRDYLQTKPTPAGRFPLNEVHYLAQNCSQFFFDMVGFELFKLVKHVQSGILLSNSRLFIGEICIQLPPKPMARLTRIQWELLIQISDGGRWHGGRRLIADRGPDTNPTNVLSENISGISFGSCRARALSQDESEFSAVDTPSAKTLHLSTLVRALPWN